MLRSLRRRRASELRLSGDRWQPVSARHRVRMRRLQSLCARLPVARSPHDDPARRRQLAANMARENSWKLSDSNGLFDVVIGDPNILSKNLLDHTFEIRAFFVSRADSDIPNYTFPIQQDRCREGIDAIFHCRLGR